MPSLYDQPFLFIIHSPLVPQIYMSLSGFTEYWTHARDHFQPLATLLSPSRIV